MNMYKSRKQENFKKANVPPLLGRAGAIGRVDKFYFFQTSRKLVAKFYQGEQQICALSNKLDFAIWIESIQ